MSYELRKIIPVIVISLALIRLWIEIVMTTILKNSYLVNQINNNQVGFHHWQLGLLISVIALLVIQIVPKWKNQVILLLGFGLALFFDQYIYVLSLAGINLPFGYRSQTDYIVIILAMIIAGLFLLYFSKTKIKRKRRE